MLTCVNVATLTLVRFVSRRREIAIANRLARGDCKLVRQMVMEGARNLTQRRRPGVAAHIVDSAWL